MDSPKGIRLFLQYHRRMLFLMLVATAAVALALAILYPEESSLRTGFMLGAAAQLLKFGLVDVAVVRKIAVEQANAAATQLKASAVTLLLFAAVAFLVVKNGFSVWAMAGGIFLPRLLLIADTYIRPNPFGNGDESEQLEETNGDEKFGNDSLHDTAQEQDDGIPDPAGRDRPPLEERRDS